MPQNKGRRKGETYPHYGKKAPVVQVLIRTATRKAGAPSKCLSIHGKSFRTVHSVVRRALEEAFGMHPNGGVSHERAER